MVKIKAGGILERRDLCLMGVMSAPDQPGIAAAIFEALGKENLNVESIVQSVDLNNESHVQFCVMAGDCKRALSLLEPIASELGARKVIVRRHVSMLSVFGPDFRELPGIAGTAFGALARTGLNILAISTSISTLTCVIEDRDYEAALEALSAVFALP